VRRTAGALAAAACVAGLVVAGAIGRPGNGGTGAAFADRVTYLDLVIAGSIGPAAGPGRPEPSPPVPTRRPPVAGPGGRYSYPMLSRPGLPLAPLGLDAGKLPADQAIAGRLNTMLHDRRLGSRVGLAVMDAATGRLVYGHDTATGFIPASTTKILTAAAALSGLGPDRRLRTSVVQTQPGHIVLVGGGDPTLLSGAEVVDAASYAAPARLSTLAERTARALVKAGVRTVSLRYDAGRFAGPGRAPSWLGSYLTPGSAVVAPVSALTVDRGYVGDPARQVRSADPARQAADVFAGQLRKAGIALSGPVLPGAAGKGATELAAVESPPISAIVEAMLVVSDNDIAEALARHVAIAGKRPATFDGAAEAVRAAVGKLGVNVDRVRLLDGSGLSRGDAIPPRVLAELLTAAAQPKHPELRTVLAGLPVAGFSGTLADRASKVPRFGSSGSGPTMSAGLVRAKTGTLTGVRSLAGYVRSADGRLLVFALVADRIPSNDGEMAEAALDAMAAALTTCCPS